MEKGCIFPVGSTLACRYAGEALGQAGCRIVDHPCPEVSHLLLDVPSFDTHGRLRSGEDVKWLLEMLPEDVTVIGGNLSHPELESYAKWDLLREEEYLCQNAAITADCALRVAAPLLKTTFRDTSALILGWGRIGKCLGKMLSALGVSVTVAARKDADRRMLEALGYRAVDFTEAQKIRPQLIFNTVPSPVLDVSGAECVKIDLASQQGLFGDGVIRARGLPGLHVPQSTGQLIGSVVLKKMKEEGL